MVCKIKGVSVNQCRIRLQMISTKQLLRLQSWNWDRVKMKDDGYSCINSTKSLSPLLIITFLCYANVYVHQCYTHAHTHNTRVMQDLYGASLSDGAPISSIACAAAIDLPWKHAQFFLYFWQTSLSINRWLSRPRSHGDMIASIPHPLLPQPGLPLLYWLFLTLIILVFFAEWIFAA